MKRLRSYAVQSPCLGCDDGIQGLGSPEWLTGVSTLSTPYVLPHKDLYGHKVQCNTMRYNAVERKMSQYKRC